MIIEYPRTSRHASYEVLGYGIFHQRPNGNIITSKLFPQHTSCVLYITCVATSVKRRHAIPGIVLLQGSLVNQSTPLRRLLDTLSPAEASAASPCCLDTGSWGLHLTVDSRSLRPEVSVECTWLRLGHMTETLL